MKTRRFRPSLASAKPSFQVAQDQVEDQGLGGLPEPDHPLAPEERGAVQEEDPFEPGFEVPQGGLPWEGHHPGVEVDPGVEDAQAPGREKDLLHPHPHPPDDGPNLGRGVQRLEPVQGLLLSRGQVHLGKEIRSARASWATASG
jgi:hypothetical protein